MSNRFASSFPPLLAGSPLQAEGSPAVPAVPGTDPTPTPRRPASPVALYGVGAHPAGCRRSPRPKFAELAQVSRGRAACPHHPRRLPRAAGTPQPAPLRRAGSPHPSIHPSRPEPYLLQGAAAAAAACTAAAAACTAAAAAPFPLPGDSLPLAGPSAPSETPGQPRQVESPGGFLAGLAPFSERAGRGSPPPSRVIDACSSAAAPTPLRLTASSQLPARLPSRNPLPRKIFPFEML